MKIIDQISSDESNVKATFACVRISDSEQMSGKSDESQWYTDFSKVLDVIKSNIIDGGEIIKVYQDGALLFFDKSINAVEAVNVGIKIHEDLAQNPIRDNFKITVKIGISNGVVKKIFIENKNLEQENQAEYFGFPIMTAEKLAERSAGRALFLDSATDRAGDMSLIVSLHGKIQSWTDEQYLSEKKQISLQGISRPVPFLEVKWDGSSHGVQASADPGTPQVDTTASGSEGVSPKTLQEEAPPPFMELPKIMRGRVSNVQDGKGYAFVEGDDGNNYFAHFNSFFDNVEAKRGDVVFFHPKPPMPGKTNPMASGIIVLDALYEGVVTNVREEGYCFIQISSDGQESHDVFYFYRDVDDDVFVGDKGELVLGESFNKKVDAFRPGTKKITWSD